MTNGVHRWTSRANFFTTGWAGWIRRGIIAATAAAILVAGGFVAYYRQSGRPLCFPTVSPSIDLPQVEAIHAPSLAEIPVPAPTDWVDYGPVLEAGRAGEWDFFFAGTTPGSVVKKDGLYYFYYVAADGYRSHDGDARHRSIGVATSLDGIHFDKFEGNPIMTHAPYGGEEEGANSAGITLDEDGRFVMFYGAAAGPHDLIIADTRVAVSEDGFEYEDMGQVLYHCDVTLYGFGDEIFPQAAYRHGSNWVLFYQPNGRIPAARSLGVASGTRPDHLPNSEVALAEPVEDRPIGVWGNVVWLGPEKIALFVQKRLWPQTYVEVRTASPATPQNLSEPVARYDIPNLKRGTVFLDRERRTWFMFYNEFSRYWHLKLAPAGQSDLTPPTVPGHLVATAPAFDQVDLAWKAAADTETGVVMYKIYRDGQLVGTTKDFAYIDRDLHPATTYRYQVRAVNFHNIEGEAAVIEMATKPDEEPPAVEAALAQGDPTRLQVVFSEPLEPQSAADTDHYLISPGLTILAATLAEDRRTVTLATESHRPGTTYELSVKGVRDASPAANQILSTPKLTYRYSPLPELVARWDFNDSRALFVRDESGYAHPAEINGAVLEQDREGTVLRFDGVDDYLFVPNNPVLAGLTSGSFTLLARVKPERLPEANRSAVIVARIGGHPDYFLGLLHTADGGFQGRILTDSEEVITIESPPPKHLDWHQVALVVDAAANTLQLYVDGSAGDARPRRFSGSVADLNGSSGDPTRDGAYYVGSGWPDKGTGAYYDRYFKGLIDEVSFFARALSPAEIEVLFGQQPVEGD